jgi:hypothetical protein
VKEGNMGDIYSIKKIGEYTPKSAGDRDNPIYLKEGEMDYKEIKAWWKTHPSIPTINGYWEEVTNVLIGMVDKLEQENATLKKENAEIKEKVIQAIAYLAEPEMNWDKAMLLLFEIVGRKYHF